MKQVQICLKKAKINRTNHPIRNENVGISKTKLRKNGTTTRKIVKKTQRNLRKEKTIIISQKNTG